MAENAV
jgi:hypothetical protein